MNDKKIKQPKMSTTERLAKASYHVQELHKLFTTRELAEILGITAQGFQYRVNKYKEEGK